MADPIQVTMEMQLAPGRSFSLDSDGDGGRIALIFGRDDVMNAIAVYTLITPANGDGHHEARPVLVTFEVQD